MILPPSDCNLQQQALQQALQAAQKAGALAINASSPLDALRAQSCGAVPVLHTYPSQSMLADALAQFLAAKSWKQVLVLQGAKPADALLIQAWQRAGKRYGLKTTETKTFKLSGDPRAWYHDAQKHDGSWWPQWLAWIQQRSGVQRETLTALGNQNYPPMEAAPGTYVRVR